MLEKTTTQHRGNLQQTVFALVRRLLAEQGVAVDVISLDSKIGELGMSSLTFAELVSELEQLYELDPFDGELSITDIVSVGDLVAAYDRCMAA